MHTFQKETSSSKRPHKKQGGIPAEQHGHKEVKCGHCGHIREADTQVPEWQCPCCSSVYSKVDPNYVLEKEQIARQERLQKEETSNQKAVRRETLTGLAAGVSIIGSAIGSAGTTCGRLAMSPTGAAIIGLLIVAGSVGYFFMKSGAS